MKSANIPSLRCASYHSWAFLFDSCVITNQHNSLTPGCRCSCSSPCFTAPCGTFGCAWPLSNVHMTQVTAHCKSDSDGKMRIQIAHSKSESCLIGQEHRVAFLKWHLLQGNNRMLRALEYRSCVSNRKQNILKMALSSRKPDGWTDFCHYQVFTAAIKWPLAVRYSHLAKALFFRMKKEKAIQSRIVDSYTFKCLVDGLL